MTPLNRLSWADLHNLAVEAPDTPMHQAVFATLDAAPLLDSSGRLRIGDIRGHLEARLESLPELRQILYHPGLFRGRPMWVDDPNFRIENHVLSATLPPPGGEFVALEFAARQMPGLLDRKHPLWQVWLLEGYSQERIGMLVKLHHALADGSAMVNLLAQIFDLEPFPSEQPAATWVPAEPPAQLELLRDSLRLKGKAVGRALARLAHPVASIRAAANTFWSTVEAGRNGWGAPRTSLNQPTGASRTIAALHLSLDEVKAEAHGRHVKVNDVFLCLVAGGLRRLLLARSEPVAGRSIHASMAVSLPDAGAPISGNHAGVVIVPLPLDVEPVGELISAVAAATVRAKSGQLPVVSTGLMVVLAYTGLSRAYIRRQHMINVLTTNLPGPTAPLYFAGARIRDPVALPPIAGNVTVSLAALSYDGGLTLSLVADALAWPDVDVFVNAMRNCWLELQAESLRSRHAA